MNHTLLYYFCHAPGGSPRSFEDLDERLELDWFKTASQGDPGALRWQERPAVLIIDEFGAAFGGDRNVMDLIAQARKKELALVLATQSVADIPDEGERERILESTNTTLVMGTRHPEQLTALAGTKFQLESSL